MDTRRAGLILILVAGIALVVWNFRLASDEAKGDSREAAAPSAGAEASGISEARIPGNQPAAPGTGLPNLAGLLSLRPGQTVSYENLPSSVQQAFQDLQDVVVVRPWPEPSWLHVLSKSSRDRPTKELRSTKLRECPLTLLMQWVFAEGCSEDSMVVDVGMNIGWFSSLAAANSMQVLAFEPSPAKVQYMSKTLALNGWSKRVRLLLGGVAEHGAQLYIDDSKWWDKQSAKREGGDSKTAVPSYRLDDVIAGSDVCVLKVDCLGCEAEAFLSGAKMIASGKLQVVQVEYDHSLDSQKALETLRELSPKPWQCIMLPVGLSCSGADLADEESETQREMWDFIVSGVASDCRASKLEQLAPASVGQSYHTDLWLVHDDTIDRLRAHPSFLAAAQRLAESEGQQCEYSEEQASDAGICDLLCHRFSSLEEAQHACNGRPTCSKVLRLQGASPSFELRGGGSPGGLQESRAHLKLACSTP
eukprot:TRINITY_DN31959_c0_g1_i1.p1 TRINITY_DN31959_c0_g1~~TRINITY_DN31959_c0_g1_i1.p1  ORF type:complete len:491 (+),score=99.44 TRINITY_DN31959_c0_g1_i1:47-1474(+)